MKTKILPIVLIVAGLGLVGFHFLRGGGSGNFDLKILAAPYIMPSAYKVYENSQAQAGRFYLFKSVITNKGSAPLRDVKVSYRIPNYIEWTEIKEIPAILPGQTIIVTCYPKFKETIIDKKTPSKESGEIKISAGGKERKETFAFEMKGVNDFVYSAIPADEQASYSDVFDNASLFSCYVTPNDPIVKYYTANIQEKILKGETAGVTRELKEAVRFLMGIYEATKRSGMVYSSTGGIPTKVGDKSSLTQSIRLPREVITGNTGLCIELSLLYASIINSAGLEPIIFLIPGHAYPGFRLNGQYVALEATGIGGENIGGVMTAEQALERGMKELDEFIKASQVGDERYKVIDINALIQDGVVAMELKDDNFLRQRVDAMAAKFGGDVPQIQNQNIIQNTNEQRRDNNNDNNRDDGNNDNRDNNNNDNNNNRGGGQAYSGVVSFNYPANWAKTNNPIPGLNYLVSSVYPTDATAGVEVYNFRGYSSVEAALQQLQNDAASLGLQITFQGQGSSGGFQKVNGTTLSQNGTFRWVGMFKVKGSNVVGISAGAYAQVYSQYSGIISSVVSSLR